MLHCKTRHNSIGDDSAKFLSISLLAYHTVLQAMHISQWFINLGTVHSALNREYPYCSVDVNVAFLQNHHRTEQPFPLYGPKNGRKTT